jgi:cytochrome c553
MTCKPLSLSRLSILGFILATGSPAWGDEVRAQALFQLCAACHGDQGEGRLDLEAPAIAGLPVWYVSAQLQKFRQGVRGSHPQDSAGMRMRPMARSLPTDRDVQAVAQYIATLPPRASPPTLSGDLTSGAQQYQLCLACHGPDGRGNQALGAPPLVLSNDWYLLNQLLKLKQNIRGADSLRDPAGAMMQPIASTLSQEAMQDVVTYIQRARHGVSYR